MQDPCRAKKICEEPDGPYMYGDMIESDLEAVRRLAEEEDFRRMYETAAGLNKWKRLSPEEG